MGSEIGDGIFRHDHDHHPATAVLLLTLSAVIETQSVAAMRLTGARTDRVRGGGGQLPHQIQVPCVFLLNQSYHVHQYRRRGHS